MEISVAVVDDDDLVAVLLGNYISSVKEMNIWSVFNNGREFLDALHVRDDKPDVLLLDYKMEDMNGAEVTEELKKNHPEIPVIMMSSYYKKAFMGFMLKTGVAAFIPKGISPEHLIKVIEETIARGFYFMEDQVEVIRKQVSGKSPRPAVSSLSGISEREIEVIKLIARQKTAKEIGEILYITQRTVEGHKNNLFAKTGTRNIAGLVIYAIQNEIIHLDDVLII